MATEQKSKPKGYADLAKTMGRVRSELMENGKSKVDIDKEASGSSELAESILRSAAQAEGLTVTTKVYKKSVTGTVSNEQAESTDES